MLAKYRPNIVKSVTLATLLGLAPVGIGAIAPSPATAQSALPAPHVSRALDAVLLPVNDSVIAVFDLAAGTRGVLVLATQPGGLAEAAGILPGDVLDYVQGTAILSPADLDLIIYNWIMEGLIDFVFDGTRGGSTFATNTLITLEYWEETIEITEISTWESYSYESFSFEEFYSEYSEELTQSYEGVSVEETTLDEEVTEDAAMEDSAADEDVTEDASADEFADDGADDGADTGDDGFDGGDDSGDAGGDEEIIE